MIERIDHVVAVVEEVDAASTLMEESGAPKLWDTDFAGMRTHGFSIGRVNLELLSIEAREFFDYRGALGVFTVGFDPGDVAQTKADLEQAGFTTDDIAPGGTQWEEEGETIIGEWSVVFFHGLPDPHTFLCEYHKPHRSYDKVAPDSPLQFIEYHVGVADVASAQALYAKAFGMPAQDGCFALGDTPVQVVAGQLPSVLIRAAIPDPLADRLAHTIRGLQFV